MRVLIRILLFSCLMTSLMAQSAEEYTRKSITFLDAIVLASPSARDMTIRQIDYTAQMVKERVQLDRFDYNPIPSESGLISSFIGRVSGADELDLDGIAELMNETFVPTIVAIMDEHAEQRASSLVSETERMSFVATKAKELGITAENLEQVFNSGYIYLPYINGYSEETEAKTEDDKTKYSVTCHLHGGIFWFKIDYVDGKTEVRPIQKKQTHSLGVATKKDAGQAEWAAFKSAVANYARNLENATKEIEDFKLKTGIVDMEGTTIGFNMGRREGLRIDDRYIVGEYTLTSSGETVFRKDGFARVKTIGDNRRNQGAMSYGYGVIVGNWAPGMSLIEYPRLALDIYGSLGTIPMATDMDDCSAESHIAVGAEMAYNIAAIMQQSHWYLTAGALIGDAAIDYSGTTMAFEATGLTFKAEVGLMKRVQLRRLDVFGRAGMGYHNTSFKLEESDGDTIQFSNDAFGLSLGAGLNVTVNIDWTIGIRYNFYTGSSDAWSLMDSDDNDLGDWSEYYLDTPLNLQYSGSAILFQISYAPPSLGFDPAAALGTMVGP